MSECLDTLIKQNINLEFTFNDYSSGHTAIRTPLMISFNIPLFQYNNHMFTILLEKGANINCCTAHGLTPLTLALEYPMELQKYKTILRHPQLTINQQNRRGESALLHCLLRRQRLRIGLRTTPFFIEVVGELLAAGADPELANNAGLTPLDAAKILEDNHLIHIIQDAIEQKSHLAQQMLLDNPTQ